MGGGRVQAPGPTPRGPRLSSVPFGAGPTGVREMLLCFMDSLCRPPIFLPGSAFLGTPSWLTLSLREAASPEAHSAAAEPLPHP